MNESDWLASEDPQAMVEWIRLGNVAADDDYPPNYSHCPVRVSDRKLRLFYLACWSRNPLAGYPRGHKQANLDRAFAFVDGLLTVDEVRKEAGNADWELYTRSAERLAQTAAAMSYGNRAALLRDIIGNPFRPVTVCPECPPGDRTQCPKWQALRTTTILSLAQAAYDERERRCRCLVPSQGGGYISTDLDCSICHGTGRIDDGTLDPDRLTVLADALEEAGCDREELLRHLRGWERNPKCMANPDRDHEGDCWIPLRADHVRGCWVIDAILGRS